MSESSSSDGEDTWIQWFCGLQGHEMFCEVDRSYIEDGFNLYGLRHWVPNINEGLDVILDRVGHTEASSELMEATYALYGLIHARYVLTTSGLEAMYAKYTLQEFGNCPHFLCRGQPVVPVGVRDEPQMETVKLYCPKCQDVYVHPSHAAQRVDGAYFGTTFPHLFFMTYGNVIPDPPEQKFVPRVFGFRLHRSAVNGASARGQGSSHQHHHQHHHQQHQHQHQQHQHQQHDRDLEQRRRQPRVPGGASGGDGPPGVMALARASEGTLVPVRRGSQAMGILGSGGAAARKKAAVGEEGDSVEAEDGGEGGHRARGEATLKADGTRSGDRSSPPPGEEREKDKDKDKHINIDGGKEGGAGTSRGRGAVENGRTSSSVRESRQATSTRSRGRTSPTGGPQGDEWAKDGDKSEVIGRDRDLGWKNSTERDVPESSGGQSRYPSGRLGGNRRGGKGQDASEAILDEEEEKVRGLPSTATDGNGNGNGNGARSQLRGQDGEGTRVRSSNGTRIAYDEGSRVPRSGSTATGSRLGSVPQERGRKRLPDRDLDVAELVDDAAGRVGGGAGDGAGRGGGGGGGGAGAGGGGGGKGRGKVARSDRNVTSARAAAMATATATAGPASAVEGGPSTRRTRGGLG